MMDQCDAVILQCLYNANTHTVKRLTANSKQRGKKSMADVAGNWYDLEIKEQLAAHAEDANLPHRDLYLFIYLFLHVVHVSPRFTLCNILLNTVMWEYTSLVAVPLSTTEWE